MRYILGLLLAVFVVFSLVGLTKEPIHGAGASFPFPIYSSWAFQYHKETSLRINYQSIGSGGGIHQISSRTVDFGASDDPLQPDKLAKSRLLQFPAIIGGIVPVVNIENIKGGELKLTSGQLAAIFLGKIKRWNDPEILRTNPGLDLPNKTIVTVHRSDGSGTTAIFTYYLSKVNPEWKRTIGYGKSVQWPMGIAGKGNEGVSGYVKKLKNTIGYIEFAYAKNNNLAYALVQNKSGKFVNPSYESFRSAASKAELKAENGFHGWLVNSTGEDSWPIAGASYILLARENTDINRSIVRFFDWAFKYGDDKAIKMAYVPLPAELKNRIRIYWQKNRLY